jgi:hypothetical protein
LFELYESCSWPTISYIPTTTGVTERCWRSSLAIRPRNLGGSGDPNIHNLILDCNCLQQKLHAFTILCVLPDWNHWNLPPATVHPASTTSVGELAWPVEHSRASCMLYSSRGLGYLLTQVFFIQFMLIHIAIRSALLYTSPRFLGKDTSCVYWTLPNFVEGRTCQTRRRG